MRDAERERQRHRQKEKRVPYGEPDVGLEPDVRLPSRDWDHALSRRQTLNC